MKKKKKLCNNRHMNKKSIKLWVSKIRLNNSFMKINLRKRKKLIILHYNY